MIVFVSASEEDEWTFRRIIGVEHPVVRVREVAEPVWLFGSIARRSSFAIRIPEAPNPGTIYTLSLKAWALR